MTTNEAAERLLETLRNEYARNRPAVLAEYLRGYEEGVRRATVERIREAMPDDWHSHTASQDEVFGYNDALGRVRAILDEEAAR